MKSNITSAWGHESPDFNVNEGGLPETAKYGAKGYFCPGLQGQRSFKVTVHKGNFGQW